MINRSARPKERRELRSERFHNFKWEARGLDVSTKHMNRFVHDVHAIEHEGSRIRITMDGA